MHLGLIIYGSLETVSGGYLYDRKLVEHLREMGDEVEIISLPWRNYGQHLTDNLSLTLRRRLRQARWDLLLQDELNHPSLFARNHWRNRPIPIISIVHHLRSDEYRPAWQNAFYRLIERQYLTSVDGFIFNSQATRRAVEQATGRKAPAVVAWPAGDRLNPTIAPEEIRQRARQPGPLRLIFVGNLIPRKGVHVLLDALARLPAAFCDLTIIGNPAVDHEYTARLTRQVQQLGLNERVTFLGALPDASLATWLRYSHVLVAPSSHEGFGIVYLEGMGFGLPAIASAQGGASDIVRDGENGFLAPFGDAETLAVRLAQMHTDRVLLEAMSLRARARFLAHPTWTETTGLVRRFLVERIAAASPRNR